MKQKPDALRINSLSDIKVRILLLRKSSYVNNYPLPCIIHIESSKWHTILFYIDWTPTQKNV